MQAGRSEKRSATALAVMLTSRERVSRTELTLTENISDRGARVITKQVWSPSDSLVIKSLEGDLQSEARVIYRQAIRENVYDSFGNVTASAGSLTNPFRYTGREWDTETNLQFSRARYYDPSVGRFLSEDPLGFKAAPNFYPYVDNRPTRY